MNNMIRKAVTSAIAAGSLCYLPSALAMPLNRHVLSSVQLDSQNVANYTATLPTGRIVTPVGVINGTPNFPTMVAAQGGFIAVLANSATPFQTITFYSRNSLERLDRLAAFAKVAPTKPMAWATSGGNGTALNPEHAGAAGVVYVPKENAALKIRQAKATLAVESNPNPIPTALLSHSDLFQGLTAGTDGIFYATGGDSDNVVALRGVHGKVQVLHQYTLQWQSFPKDQYPYQYQGDHQKKHLFYPDSVVVGPSNHHLYVTGMLSNSLARVNIATGETDYVNVGAYPFAVMLADQRQRLVVSDWGGNGVTVLDRATFHVIGHIATGPAEDPATIAAGVHPTAMTVLPDSPDVFVADANVDKVVEVDTQTMQPLRVIDDSPYHNAPPGSYPDALAIADGELFVANSGNNDVAVYDVHTGERLGLIPTAWYPTALAVNDGALYVTCAKGLGSGPNLQWQYIGNMMHGVLQKVNLSELPRHLAQWTQESLHNDGFTQAQRTARHTQDARTTTFLKKHIRYVVFILRENKSFDEDLGDYSAAGKWADSHFDLYNQKELPNLYSLAHHYALFVNFMADGEVTAQGHQWVDGASDSDVVQRLWPEYYSNRGLLWNAGPGGSASLKPQAPGAHNPHHYYEKLGDFTNPWISYPQRLYLFNNLLQNQVSFEDFGEDTTRARDGVIRSVLKSHVAKSYPSWDRMILDTDRAKLAIDWLKKHPGAKFPHFVYIWLPDDHTAGLAPCYYTPDYFVANNDYATATFIHYLSTTPEWKHMVVFLTEDDAQSGADHINAHRTLALAMGPWVKKGALETHLYSQVNIVKTIEATLGLPPMSQWDASAAVLSGVWTNHPDFALTPTVLPIRVPVAFNMGKCTEHFLLRREAGATGHILTPAWLKAHTDAHGRHLAPVVQKNAYTPTSLLKVSGPEQLKQEWIASKGVRSYDHFMAYLHRYAQAHRVTIASYEANEGT
ncbi:MAG: quinoprotein amine dehydrogenase, beta chain-like protein [Ferrovum sp.]|nr:quinoprotein amine dehydrogenase, beta chain-like protein [Ferrovum sp.]